MSSVHQSAPGCDRESKRIGHLKAELHTCDWSPGWWQWCLQSHSERCWRGRTGAHCYRRQATSHLQWHCKSLSKQCLLPCRGCRWQGRTAILPPSDKSTPYRPDARSVVMVPACPFMLTVLRPPRRTLSPREYTGFWSCTWHCSRVPTSCFTKPGPEEFQSTCNSVTVCLACKHLHAMFQQLVVKTRPLIKLALGKSFLAFVHRHAQGLWRIWSRRQNLIGKEQVALQRQLHRWATRRAGRGCAPGLPWLRTGPIMKARPLAWHAPMQSHGDVEWQPSLPQKPLPQVGIGHRDNDVRRINTERHGKNRHPTETKEPERPKRQQSGGSRAPERRGHQRVTNEPSRKQEHKTQAAARNQKTRAVAWVAKPPEAKKNRHFHKPLSHQKDCGQMGNNTLLKPSVAWQVHWFSKSNTTWRQRGTGQRNENNGAKKNSRTLGAVLPTRAEGVRAKANFIIY